MKLKDISAAMDNLLDALNERIETLCEQVGIEPDDPILNGEDEENEEGEDGETDANGEEGGDAGADGAENAEGDVGAEGGADAGAADAEAADAGGADAGAADGGAAAAPAPADGGDDMGASTEDAQNGQAEESVEQSNEGTIGSALGGAAGTVGGALLGAATGTGPVGSLVSMAGGAAAGAAAGDAIGDTIGGDESDEATQSNDTQVAGTVVQEGDDIDGYENGEDVDDIIAQIEREDELRDLSDRIHSGNVGRTEGDVLADRRAEIFADDYVADESALTPAPTNEDVVQNGNATTATPAPSANTTATPAPSANATAQNATPSPDEKNDAANAEVKESCTTGLIKTTKVKDFSNFKKWTSTKKGKSKKSKKNRK